MTSSQGHGRAADYRSVPPRGPGGALRAIRGAREQPGSLERTPRRAASSMARASGHRYAPGRVRLMGRAVGMPTRDRRDTFGRSGNDRGRVGPFDPIRMGLANVGATARSSTCRSTIWCDRAVWPPATRGMPRFRSGAHRQHTRPMHSYVANLSRPKGIRQRNSADALRASDPSRCHAPRTRARRLIARYRSAVRR